MQSLITPSHHTRVLTKTLPTSLLTPLPPQLISSNQKTKMATTTYDRQQHFTTGGQPHYRQEHAGDRFTYPNQHFQGQSHGQGPSTSKIMAIMGLLPVGGILLGLAGITFVGTIIGLAVSVPLFVIFSPVIVPALLTIGLAVAGFLTSGTFGLTGLSSLSYLFNMLRQSSLSVGDQMDYVKGKLQDVGEYTGQKTKDLGQKIQHTAHEVGDMNVGGGQGQGQVGVHAQVGGGVGGNVGGGKEGGKGGGKGGDRT